MILNAQSELNPKNKVYLRALKSFIWESFKQDLNRGDWTTRFFLDDASKKVIAQITAQEAGILAGIQEAQWFLKKSGIRVLEVKKDGTELKKNTLILKIEGKANKILSVERTLLNLLQRMSGVATKTQKITQKLNPKIKLLATRKTLWGLLDKRAVTVGGGGTHRLNLSDAILIKDNHLDLVRNFKKSFQKVLKKTSAIRFVEVELQSAIQVKEFLEIIKSLKVSPKNLVVMLDNFSPQQIKKNLPALKKIGVLIELSGGINEKNISRYNVPGVDAISSSVMTMNAPHLNLSLDILKNA